MYTKDFTRALAVAEITAPAYACEARTTDPLVRSSTRSNAFASSLRDVKGIGAAITLHPLACKGRMTLLQLEPSAHAPWTMTMVNASLLPFIRPPAPGGTEMARPLSASAPFRLLTCARVHLLGVAPNCCCCRRANDIA